ncbi:pectate lyase [Asticcacaulis sp. YBE204]|uniref:pectate lyase n=1 Tax=Asticcacaulis sp. YBE204 TaxID=1282363 RepID=UPI0003C3B67C|nr:pectate lyase [Asticcacaulis sp. YBE204]ESQ78929.1 hypothetical protein AEYBE204_10930 [Asticcacaulis sp. YBE204]
MLRRHFLASMTLLAGSAALPSSLFAAQVGVNEPAHPLTRERIAALPAGEQKPWLDYLAKSDAQGAADKAALIAERKGLTEIPADPKGGTAPTMPLTRPADWYAGPEARAIADNIVSFQTPAGGWGKNQLRNTPPRLKGQTYVPGDVAAFKVDPAVPPKEIRWSYVGTIDNGAATTELGFLARVATALPGKDGDVYRTSFGKGLNWLLNAQYPNGGWPQIWPLQGEYHDAITLNDDAMVHVLKVLAAIGRGEEAFAFVSASDRARAAAAEQKGIAWLLAAQVTVNGRKTLWAQQHDVLTLAPATARAYEPSSLSGSESAGVLIYLMSLKNPSPQIIASVAAGVTVLRETKLEGVAFVKVSEDEGKRLVPQAGAGPLWARYYDAKTLKPIFGNRDRKLYDSIDDIEKERRNGYAWFGNGPQKAIEAYDKWAYKR